MLRSILAAAAVALVTACAGITPCPPGSDCRWLVDGERLALWAAAEPTVAAVVRFELPTLEALHAYVVWERCGEERCPWEPPSRPQSLLERFEGGTWVVSLPRPAFAPDPASEVVLAVGDGTTARVGWGRGLVAEGETSLGACTRDLTAALAGASPEGAPQEGELELACRIFLHPGQGREAMHWHPLLHAAARAHACDMAGRDYFDHTDPEGIGPNRRARDAGYVLAWWYDASDDANEIESLALRGPHSTPATTLQQWLDSSPHRSHVLAEHPGVGRQHDVAVGYCLAPAADGAAPAPGGNSSASSGARHYWVFVSAETGTRPPAGGPEGDHHGERHRHADALQSQR
jgi:hypothetical protein